jgi:hypothetical protein
VGPKWFHDWKLEHGDMFRTRFGVVSEGSCFTIGYTPRVIEKVQSDDAIGPSFCSLIIRLLLFIIINCCFEFSFYRLNLSCNRT